MNKKDNEILLEYLRSILYDSVITKPDLAKLDESSRRFGVYMEALQGTVERLRKREDQLREEREKLNARAEIIESYNELLMEMSRRRHEWVVVADAQDHTVRYCNRSVNEGTGDIPLCEKCECNHPFLQKILEWQGDSQRIWEYENDLGNCYSVNSFPVIWRKHQSFVHIISDVTKERQEKDILESKAYYDVALGIRNRRFFTEYMDQVLRDKKTVTLCYLDMDGLKYVNDRYGHMEGDHYIKAFVEVVHRHFRRGDILARVGGDEFALILNGNLAQLAASKLETARNCFRAENKKEYPVSFSYGIYLIDGENNHLTLEQIIEAVDAYMYEFKRKYKEARPSEWQV